MSQNRLPKYKDPLADIADLSIKPMAELEETNRNIDEDEEMLEPKEDVSAKDVFKKYQKEKTPPKNVKMEVVEDTLENNTDLDIPEDKMRGQRGKDKKKRKKKVLTQSQLDGLAKGRLKSMETRKRNKEARASKKKTNSHLDNTPQMEAPKKNTKLDYDTFSNYMDMYEEKRKKKHSNTKEPHPNKAIPNRMRPIPPTSQPRRIPRAKKVANWTGHASTFATHKTGGGRWNYGI